MNPFERSVPFDYPAFSRADGIPILWGKCEEKSWKILNLTDFYENSVLLTQSCSIAIMEKLRIAKMLICGLNKSIWVKLSGSVSLSKGIGFEV